MTTNRYAFESAVYGDALDLDALNGTSAREPLPTLDSIPYGTSVRALADALYPGVLYNAALPQGWVDSCIACGYNPRSQWVWGYPSDGPEGGVPLPLIRESVGWRLLSMGVDDELHYPFPTLIPDGWETALEYGLLKEVEA